MSCGLCDECIAPEGWLCKDSGNFFTTGEYAKTVDSFNIHGVSFNQKVDSVKHQLDYNTLQILKALFADNDCPNGIDYLISLQVYGVLDFIQSRLSNNVDNNSYVLSKNDEGDD